MDTDVELRCLGWIVFRSADGDNQQFAPTGQHCVVKPTPVKGKAREVISPRMQLERKIVLVIPLRIKNRARGAENARCECETRWSVGLTGLSRHPNNAAKPSLKRREDALKVEYNPVFLHGIATLLFRMPG
jgi:hypothetical protein